MQPVLGIDLGTTNSVVSCVVGDRVRVLTDGDGSQLVPSVVSFHPNGDVLVGRLARSRRLIDARNTIYSVKRLIGRPFESDEVRRARERFAFEIVEGPKGAVHVSAAGHTYALPEISALVLGHVRSIAEQALGFPCRRAVLTVPANFNELQRSATKAAAKVAGLQIMRVLNEPTAAALAYGQHREGRERVAIYDFGGGTFDVTILELAGDVYEVIATAGDSFLGGDDIDLQLAEQFSEIFRKRQGADVRGDLQAFERVRAAAEWAKCSLSDRDEVKISIDALANGADGVPLDLVVSLRRVDMERSVRPLIERSFDVCERAMTIAGVRPTQLDNVILVGGSTRMPLVREMVREYFGREPLTSIDPDMVVSQGAAIHGASLAALSAEEPQEDAGSMAARADVERMQRERSLREATPKGPAFAPERPRYVPPSPKALEPKSKRGFDPEDTGRHSHPPGPVPGLPQPSRPPPAGPSGEPTLAIDTSDKHPKLEDAAPAGRPVTLGRISVTKPMDKAAALFEPFDAAPAPAEGARAQAAAPAPAKAASLAPAKAAATPSIFAPFGGEDLAASDGSQPIEFGALPGTGNHARPPNTGSHPQVLEPSAKPSGARSGNIPALPPAASSGAATVDDFEALGLGLAAEDVPTTTHDASMSVAKGPPALLLDVTPHTLGVETVSGFCEPIIDRNAAIPLEQTRIFSTASDDQDTVRVRICQGESRRMSDNQLLGEVELAGLRAAARGSVKIRVTFTLDSDGTLGVTAEDAQTKQAQKTKINLLGGVAGQEIEQMQERHKALLGGG